MQQLTDMLGSMGLTFALLYGVIFGIISMLSYIIWMGIIHFAATMFLGGDGSYPGVLHRTSIPMIVWIVVNLVIGGIGTYIMFSSFGDLAQANDTSAYYQMQQVVVV
jgi:hypothetical protein